MTLKEAVEAIAANYPGVCSVNLYPKVSWRKYHEGEWDISFTVHIHPERGGWITHEAPTLGGLVSKIAREAGPACVEVGEESP